MKKIHNKQLQNIICSVIAVVMIFGVLATVAYTEDTQPDTFQRVILEAIGLPESQRAQFVDDVLANLTVSNYKSYVDDAKRILGIAVPDADLELALKSYANYPDIHKSTLNSLVKTLELPKDSYNVEGFSDIEHRINLAVTGNASDDRGFKLFVELLSMMRTFNSKPILYDGSSSRYEIDIKVEGNKTLKAELDVLILYIESLNARGITDLDGFINYIENEINTNPYSQIYSLKVFLKDELGASFYSGELPKPDKIDPLQVVLLQLLNLTDEQKEQFVDEILVKLTPSNYTSYVISAKRILGVSVSDADVEDALKVYASYSSTYKNTLNEIIKTFKLSVKPYYTDSFSDIERRINLLITGDSWNQQGFRLFIELLEQFKAFNSNPVFYDDATDKYKLDINVNGNDALKSKLNILISSIQSLESKGITNFDEFVAYMENEINTNAYSQIYNLKVFLKEEFGSSAYSGNLPKPDDFEPLHRVLLQLLNLSAEKREQFINDILAKLTPANYKNYVINAKRILGVCVSDADTEKALETYAKYPSSYKSTLNEMIKTFALPEGSYNTAEFPDITKRINFLVTGDSSNNDGFKLFVEVFKSFKTFNSQPVFYDGDSDIYQLDIRVDGNVSFKGAMDKMLKSVDALNDRGVNDFDGFVEYFEDEINANSYLEIYSFKKFLNDELGASAYAGSLPVPKDPLQLVLLAVLNLPQSKRIQFVNEVLVKVTSSNYTSYVNKAQIILGVSISDSDMENALRVYASFSQSNRAKIEGLIKLFDLTGISINTSNFSSLAGDINYEITGNCNDNTGIKFVVKSLEYVSVLTGPMVTDGKSNMYKVDFLKPDNDSLISNLDYLISLIKSLESRGVTDFDSFLAVAEDIVNANDDIEIYYFKKYLKDQYGKSVYIGTLPYPGGTTPQSPSPTPTSTKPVSPSPTPTSTKPQSPSPTPTSTTPQSPSPTPTSTTPQSPSPTPTSTAPQSPSPTPTSTTPVITTPTSSVPTSPVATSKPTSKQTKKPSDSTPTPTSATTPEVTQPVQTMPAAPFNDIAGHWAEENIIRLAERGIIHGYPDGSVKPDAEITRAEMAVIVVLAAGLQPAETITLKFKDTDQIPSWAIGFVQTGVDNGIIYGYEDNTFRASNNLTREEMVVLIMQAFKYGSSENLELEFIDSDEIGDWSKPFVVKSVEMAFVAGYPDNTFKPKRNVTRAEAFTVLLKAIEEKEADVVEEEDSDESTTEEETTEEASQ